MFFVCKHTRKYLAADALIGGLTIVHCVFSIVEGDLFVFPHVLQEHVVAFRLALQF